MAAIPASPERMDAVRRLGRATRSGDPDLIAEARAELAVITVEDYLGALPPITAEQKARLVDFAGQLTT